VDYIVLQVVHVGNKAVGHVGTWVGNTFNCSNRIDTAGGSVGIGGKNRRPLLDRMLRSSAHLPTIVPGVTHSYTIAQKIIYTAMDTTQCNCKKDTVPPGRQFIVS